ncbi:MAG TPA: DUF58 domain-containing protein [Gemmatimonadaceae bacterium]|nr:DUF58 domain-containing protein [Gemmatimonadaceae bacterium]
MSDDAIHARGPRLRVAPRARLAYIAAALAVLWFLPYRIATYAVGAAVLLLLIAVLADFLILPTRRALSLRREFPSRAGLGESIAGSYELASRWRWPVEITLRDELPGAIAQTRSGISLPVAAGSQHAISTTLTPMARGEHELGRVALLAHSRIGLLGTRDVFAPDDRMLVIPSIANVRRFRLLAVQHRLQTAGVRVLKRRGDGRAFAGLRDYVPGDDPRHMDWKATGRRAKHIVREYSVEQSQSVFALIEAGRSMTQLAGDFPRFEHALSAALVLTDVAATTGDRVGTLVFDDRVRAFVAAQRGKGALAAIRTALIPVRPTMTEPDYAGAFRHLATHQRRRALIVFFTDAIDVRASRALIAYVTRSAARHLVVVVALRNDALFAAANLEDRPPARERELPLFESAAAEELISARREALERMRRAGVTVLDVSPQTMTAAVINRYLEIKARGAL